MDDFYKATGYHYENEFFNDDCDMCPSRSPITPATAAKEQMISTGATQPARCCATGATQPARYIKIDILHCLILIILVIVLLVNLHMKVDRQNMMMELMMVMRGH